MKSTLMLSLLVGTFSHWNTLSAQGLSVNTQHPRIWLTPELIARLKAKARSNDPVWASIKRDADKLLMLKVEPFCRSCSRQDSIEYSYQGLGWLEAIEVLGAVYVATGDPKYTGPIIAVLGAANAATAAGDLTPISADSGYPSRTAALALALGYDWAYDRLGNSTRIETIKTLNTWFDWFKRSAYQKDGPPYGNYFGGHILGFGVAGLATYGDNLRATELISYIRRLFDEQVDPAFSDGAFAGGYPVESFNYGPNHFVRLLEYMLAVKSATGEDLFASRDYGRRMATNLIYNLKPNRWQTTDEGDFPGDFTGVMPGNLPLLLSYLLDGSQEGQWMQYFYLHLKHDTPPGAIYVQSPTIVERFLFEVITRPASSYLSGVPLFYRSAGDGHVFARTSFQDDATWVSFAAAAGPIHADHEAKKAGHVSIQRGNDYLLVNAGQWKGKTGTNGNPQAFSLVGAAANTLYFDDFGDYLYSDSAYKGGQGYWGSNQTIAFEGTERYVYCLADLTDAYDRKPDQRDAKRRSLRSFRRSFVFLSDGTVVLFDHVEASKAEYVKTLLFHVNPSNGRPSINLNHVTVTTGTSSMTISAIWPRDPMIVVNNDTYSETNGAVSTYRVEIGARDKSAILDALNILSVSDLHSPLYSGMAVESTGGLMFGAALNQHGRASILLFARGAINGDIEYRLQTPTVGGATHMLFGIRPGQYDLYRDGSLLDVALRVPASGVLSFESSGGVNFRLRLRG